MSKTKVKVKHGRKKEWIEVKYCNECPFLLGNIDYYGYCRKWYLRKIEDSKVISKKKMKAKINIPDWCYFEEWEKG